MFIVYDLAFILFVIVYIPYLVAKRKFHRGFWQRFGIFPPETTKAIKGGRNIWIHAVSIGEILSVAGLVQRLNSRFPKYQIVISTVTKAGYDVACNRYKNDHVVIYAPLDLSFIVRRYVQLIQPKMYIAAETEIWPNLFTCLGKLQIPLIQVNGRMSNEAFRGYKRFLFIFKRALHSVDMFCMQGQTDAEKILGLGIEKKKICVAGNLKFDDLPSVSRFGFKDFGFVEENDLWIAGSTHPGEEKIVLDIFKTISSEFPKLRLIIAPRHVERTGEIVRIVEEEGFEAIKFSQIQQSKFSQNSVVIIDTVGYLKTLYNFAKIVFIGKSLTGSGGQNIIEPAFFAKPVLVGPNMENFQDVMDLFLEEKAIIQVQNSAELLLEISFLLKNPEKIKALGLAAQKVIEKHQGASDRTLEIISGLLPSVP